jgi:hypothetical protein
LGFEEPAQAADAQQRARNSPATNIAQLLVIELAPAFQRSKDQKF